MLRCLFPLLRSGCEQRGASLVLLQGGLVHAARRAAGARGLRRRGLLLSQQGGQQGAPSGSCFLLARACGQPAARAPLQQLHRHCSLSTPCHRLPPCPQVHKGWRDEYGAPYGEGDVVGCLLLLPEGGRPMEKGLAGGGGAGRALQGRCAAVHCCEHIVLHQPAAPFNNHPPALPCAPVLVSLVPQTW